MMGLLYLFLCIGTGKELAEAFYFKKLKKNTGNRIWILLPAAFGIGTLCLTWGVYLISLLWETASQSRHPLFTGNLVVMCLAGAALAAVYIHRFKAQKRETEVSLPGPEWKTRLFFGETVYFLCLAVFLLWIFFYVFFIAGDRMYAGFTVFSDYAPHTSMIRSFSAGNNFPTQYPHFGGEDVKYHFMFQFLVGNLEYLGLRLDVAYNLVSIFSLLGMLMLLYSLAFRITGSFGTGVFSGILFFFRCGLAFFRFVWEHWRVGDLAEAIVQNPTFLGYTQSENWGLWCFNVYLNQRHLAFGLLIAELLIWRYLDWLEEADAWPEKGSLWLKERFFSKSAWGCRDLSGAVLSGVLLGMAAFWNGAAVIGGLLILAGFAAASDHKLDYLATAVLCILLSILQARVFIRSSGSSPAFRWGLLADDKSPAGVLWYLFQISGIFFLALVFVGIFLNRLQRMALFGFLIPLVFAFTVSLTPDITVNHKYVMIAYAFVTIFWADALVRLWKQGKGWRLWALTLFLALTLTGLYDFVIVVKNNGPKHSIEVNLKDDTLCWLQENLSSRDLILTPPYAMNEITLSGCMLYCGWPYYAWSAGYDTDTRFQTAKEIYSSWDRERVEELVRETQARFLLYDAREQEYDNERIHEELLAECYPLVFENAEGNIRIYRVY